MNCNQTIVTIHDGVPVLENAVGCKLVPHRDSNGWGLGTFFFNHCKLGDTVESFLTEEFSMDLFKASSFTIVENTTDRGVVRFSGKDGKLAFDVTITLKEGCHAYTLDFVFDPLHPLYHPLYVNVPFAGNSSSFVKFPYETTITPQITGRWSIKPDFSRAPFLFGNMTEQGNDFFVGVGYSLQENFVQGRLEYDPAAYPNTAFKIFTPFEGMARPIDLQCVTRFELVRSELSGYCGGAHKMSMVYSTAHNQFDCIRSYIALCGYNDGIELFKSIKLSTAALFKLYKQAKGYVPGKGYHQLIRFDTGDFDTTVPHGWYSKYIVTGPQLLLADQLYQFWKQNQGEAWARTRALEMADFALSMQEDNGAFTNWDTDIEDISIMHPNDVEGTEFNQCIYSVSDIGLGICHWLSLYKTVRMTESIDRVDWKEGISKAVRFIASLVNKDGELGRNYDLNGCYDKLTSCVIEALQGLDQALQEFPDIEIERARDRLERWVYANYIQTNNWCNGSVDGGAWQGFGWPPPHNNDLMGVFNFASYCVERYRATGIDHYISKAKDAVAYIWTAVMPVEMEGFSLPTRTLVREQDFYSIYGVLIRGNDSIEFLPYLAKITGDPFFMRFYRLIIQVQIRYQAFDQPYAGFHIGLECDESGCNPIDRYAEGNIGYITRFVPQFLKSVNNEIAYRYVGGPGWGLGADYHPSFNPDMGAGNPYVLCASTMVRDISWDKTGEVLSVYLYSTEQIDGCMEIRWPKENDLDNVRIDFGQQIIDARECYNDTDEVISVIFRHDQPSKLIRIGKFNRTSN